MEQYTVFPDVRAHLSGGVWTQLELNYLHAILAHGPVEGGYGGGVCRTWPNPYPPEGDMEYAMEHVADAISASMPCSAYVTHWYFRATGDSLGVGERLEYRTQWLKQMIAEAERDVAEADKFRYK